MSEAQPPEGGEVKEEEVSSGDRLDDGAVEESEVLPGDVVKDEE